MEREEGKRQYGRNMIIKGHNVYRTERRKENNKSIWMRAEKETKREHEGERVRESTRIAGIIPEDLGWKCYGFSTFPPLKRLKVQDRPKKYHTGKPFSLQGTELMRVFTDKTINSRRSFLSVFRTAPSPPLPFPSIPPYLFLNPLFPLADDPFLLPSRHTLYLARGRKKITRGCQTQSIIQLESAGATTCAVFSCGKTQVGFNLLVLLWQCEIEYTCRCICMCMHIYL